MAKDDFSGWYHDSEFSGTNSIFYWPIKSSVPGNYHNGAATKLCINGNTHGPFKTFTECKKDALEYHRTTVEVARQAIWEVKDTKRKDAVIVEEK